MKKTIITATFILMLLTLPSFAGAPTDAVNTFVDAVVEHKGEKSWSMLSIETQNAFEDVYEMILGFAAMDPEGAEMLEGIENGKDFWVKLVSGELDADMGDMTEEFKNTTVLSEKITGNKAVVKIKTDTSEEELNMIKENGAWKIDMAEEMSME